MRHGLMAAGVAAFIASGAAYGHGASHDKEKSGAKAPMKAHAMAEEKPFGRAGDARLARRIVTVNMSDRMRFDPAEITIRRGETVRFVVKNEGRILHEMVLGTMDELKTHAELMKKFPGMEHDEPYMTHVDPGKNGEMVWQFTKAGEFFYGCLIPGHFEAGMIGRVRVTQ